MGENVKILFNQGYVSARDETELVNGELVSGVGAIYKSGDPTRIWKEPGRSLHYTAEQPSRIDGLSLLVWDGSIDATEYSDSSTFTGSINSDASFDKVVALVSGNLVWADAIDGELSGVFVSGALPSGLVFSRMHTVHYDDDYFISVEDGRPYAITPTTQTSGNIRRMGMLSPLETPILSGAGIATYSLNTSSTVDNVGYIGKEMLLPTYFVREYRQFYAPAPRFFIGDFVDIEKQADNDLGSFAYGTISSEDRIAAVTMMLSGFPSVTGTGRRISSRFQVVPGGGTDPGGGDIGTGTSLGATGATLTMMLYYQEPSTFKEVPLEEFQEGHPNAYPIYTNPPSNSAPNQADEYYPYSPKEVPPEGKGMRLYQQKFKVSMDKPATLTVDIPDEMDTSGLYAYICLSAEGVIGNNGDYGSFQPPFPYDWGNMETTTLRLFDFRITDGANSSLFGAPSGVRYAICEADQTNGIQSAPGPQSDTLIFEDRAGAYVTLPSGVKNTNSTHFYIYRSQLPDGIPASGVADGWNNFGKVGEALVELSGTFWTDDFVQWPITSQPIPIVPTIQVDGDDQTTTFYLRDLPPSSLRAMNLFKGSIVALGAVNRRQILYSYAGYPNSWPSFHVIDAIPLKEKDKLVGLATINNVLLVLAEGALLTMLEVPHIRQGRLVASDVDVIEGAPGCVGDDAYTEMAYQSNGVWGLPQVAYVSIHGIFVTDGHRAISIGEDLDWENEVNANTLYTSVLKWDNDYRVLYFFFDKDGDGVNDHYFIFHMDENHHKKNNQPKITGPTPGKITDMDMGQVGNDYKIFTGGELLGKIFQERIGTTDDSNSWPGGTNIKPWEIRTGRHYNEWDHWSVIRGNLRHTNWGNQTTNIEWTAGRDDKNIRQIVNKTVSLNGKRGHEFLVARNGEWHQIEMQHYTSGIVGGVHHIMGKVTPHGPIGDN